MTRHLLCFGFGYVAKALAGSLNRIEWQITGTTRRAENATGAGDLGVRRLAWPGVDVAPVLAEATHILSSVPPGVAGDPVGQVLARHAHNLAPNLKWLGLLSTTGVYGDQQGAWVNEDAPLVPASHRGALRALQETAWQDLHETFDLPVHVFRLSGIYGPGRSAFDKLRNGSARRIIKPGQVFSRCHIDDIVQILQASMERPVPGRIYNVADDHPAPPQDVVAEAARLLNLPVPSDQDFETAEMPPMARSFYADNKRISNQRIKEELDVTLKYPDFHAGLRAILAGGG